MSDSSTPTTPTLSKLRFALSSRKAARPPAPPDLTWRSRTEEERQRAARVLEESEAAACADAERTAARIRDLRARQMKRHRSGDASTDGASRSPPPDLPPREVKLRLQFRREPMTLFGESDEARAARLRALDSARPLDYGDRLEQDWANLVRESRAVVGESELVRRKFCEMDAIFQKEDRKPENEAQDVLFWARDLFAAWQHRLASSDAEAARFKQTQLYIRPLLVQLATGVGLQDIIFTRLREIQLACSRRDYRTANDAYYRLAIGNAPWPMGVTMVGIHERSSREKIAPESIAHVLNDETQRKYISAVKRLITFSERFFPAQGGGEEGGGHRLSRESRSSPNAFE